MTRLVGTLFALASACAAAPTRQDGEGFTPLFNGKDLSGWIQVNCDAGTFTAKDGVIFCTGKPTGVLRTSRQFENFALELEWKHLKEGGNAGLFIHSAALPARGVPFTKSIEVQIMLADDPTGQGRHTRHGDIFSIHGARFVPDRPHPQKWERCLPSENRVKPAGEWNHYRVECKDGKIDLAVNGKVVSGGSNCNPRKGYICLESEGSPVEFRNIRIKEFASSNPPAEEVAEADEGFVLLYTGVDLKGWREDAPGKGKWEAKDWTLNGGGSTLRTEKEFADFSFIADWKTARPTGQRHEVVIYLGPAPLYLSTAEVKQAQWNRLTLTRKKGRLTTILNGQQVADSDFAGPAQGSIGLHCDGAIQFANLYVKELR
jgi:hypothetical protein